MFANHCNACHRDNFDGTFAGAKSFNASALTYPTLSKYAAYSANSAADLAEFIEHNMGHLGCTTSQCATDVAAYLWAYRSSPDTAIRELSVTGASFSDQALNISLSCDSADTSINYSLYNPRGQSVVNAANLIPVEVTAGSMAVVSSDQVVIESSALGVTLNGAGIDIWGQEIHFHGLFTKISNGALNHKLQVSAVSGVDHDFAKVGLLVSSTADLSGQLAFVHWSGRRGLALDHGAGALSTYRLLHANPAGATSLTPTPATVRLVYSGGNLQMGACYNCSEPELAPISGVNFVPKGLWVVASSHSEAPLAAQIRLTDGAAAGTGRELLHTGSAVCSNGQASISLSGSQFSAVEQLELEVAGTRATVAESITRGSDSYPSCSASAELAEPKLRRLSQQQIRNSLEDIFGEVFDPAIWPELEDGARLIGMNTLADKLTVNSLNYERLYNTARAVAQALMSRHSAISSCAKSSDRACVRQRLDSDGLKLWRRPLSSAERSALVADINALPSNRSALEYLYSALILSDPFLFRSEIGEADGNQRRLTNYEVVTLLAYSVWNSTPDATLLQLASRAAPLTAADLSAQLPRMLEHPRARQALVDIYKDYLKVDLVLQREKGAEFKFDQSIRAALLQSFELGVAANLTSANHYMDVFTANQFFVNSVTAGIFGVSASHSDQRALSFNAGQRHGLLNHPAFLAVHATDTQSGIVKRGVFTLEQLLCQEMPEPPGDVMGLPIPLDLDPESTSERELLQITHSSQATCMACHSFIDPAGFGFENFDTLGRYRTTEKNQVPIDASGVLEGVGSHRLSYANSAEYSRELIGSPQMQQCVARRFLEHYLSETLPADACEVGHYQRALANGEGGVHDLLRALVQLDSFTLRQDF